MSQRKPFIPNVGFLRLPQILTLFPISKSSWWAGCRSGRYPKPVKLGPRTTVWRAEDIEACINTFNGQKNDLTTPIEQQEDGNE